jgi:hypothetical protein
VPPMTILTLKLVMSTMLEETVRVRVAVVDAPGWRSGYWSIRACWAPAGCRHVQS